MTAIEINHHYPNSDPEISRRLGRIEKAQEVAQNNDVIQSVVTLLTNIAEAIRDAASDQVKVEALATQLDVQTQALADAVAASTPAAPTP